MLKRSRGRGPRARRVTGGAAEAVGSPVRDVGPGPRGPDAVPRAGAPHIAVVTDRDGTIEFIDRTLSSDGSAGFLPPQYRETARAAIRRAFETGEPAGYDTEVVAEPGTSRWYHTDVGPVREDGRVVAVMIATTDITGRREAEAALRRSEERYRIVTGLSSDYAYAYRVEPDGSLVSEWVTGTLTRITGFSPDEIGDRAGWANLVIPEDAAIAEDQLVTVRSGRPSTVEYRIAAKGGRVLWVRDYAEPVVDDSTKRVTRIFGAVKDITEQRRALDALRESEEKYRNVVERASDGIAVIRDALLKYVNPNLAAMAGYRVEELVDTPFTQYIHEDEREWVLSRYQRRMAGEDLPPVYQTALRHKDGRRVEVEFNAGLVPYEGAMADLVFVRDITERRRTEDELRQRTDDLALLKELSNAANRGESKADILARLSSEVALMFRCRGTSVYLMSEDRSELVLQNLGGYPRALLERIEAAIGMKIPSRVAARLVEGSVYREVLEGGMPRLFSGPGAVKRLIADFAGSGALRKLVPLAYAPLGTKSVAVIPLALEGEAFGVMEASRNEPFTASDLSRLDVIARHVTTILRQQRDESRRRAD